MNNVPTITVLTPAYNKGKTIKRTFESLLNQTCFDFEWVLINDGSTDNTLEVINGFQTDKFPIRFTNKQNEGLNRTYNLGVRLAEGKLIFRLDPDDYLVEDAIESVIQYTQLLDSDDQLCSVAFLTKYSNGKIVGTHPYTEPKRSNFIDYRILDKGRGDRIEVVKREVLLQYPMPEIEGEKFCLESVMQQNIAEEYDALYIPKAIYIREYNEASITSNLVRVFSQNPEGTLLTYSQSVNILVRKQKEGYPVRKEIFKTGINYFRFCLYSKEKMKDIFKKVPKFICFECFVPGMLLYGIDQLNPNWVYNSLFWVRKNIGIFK